MMPAEKERVRKRQNGNYQAPILSEPVSKRPVPSQPK